MTPPCSGCGGPHPFDTVVPSPLWNRVIRETGRPDYLCLICIVQAFAQAGESFTAQFVGDGIVGRPLMTFNDQNVPGPKPQLDDSTTRQWKPSDPVWPPSETTP